MQSLNIKNALLDDPQWHGKVLPRGSATAMLDKLGPTEASNAWLI
jgi:hypothetical protein